MTLPMIWHRHHHGDVGDASKDKENVKPIGDGPQAEAAQAHSQTAKSAEDGSVQKHQSTTSYYATESGCMLTSPSMNP